MSEAKRYVGIRISRTEHDKRLFGDMRRFYYYARSVDEVVKRAEMAAFVMQPDIIKLDTGVWKTHIDDQRKSGIGT